MINRLIYFGFFIIAYCTIINSYALHFQIKNEWALSHHIAKFRHVEFNHSDLVEVYAVIFNHSPKARLYRQPAIHQLEGEYLDAISQQEKFLVAINGGFYTPDFKPAGLYTEKGKHMTALAKNKLLATCIRIDKLQKIHLEKNRDACLGADTAMQTGLSLIYDGKVNPDLARLALKLPKLADFFSQKRRSILAETEDDKLIVLVTSPVKLEVIAALLQKFPQAFGVKKIKMALTLDGGSSSSLLVKFPEAPFYFHEMLHVKTFIFFDA